ncbi:MAG TPA: response regulator [Polyangia bacterium]|nr:response regulator [Polyangia bacterium]
MKRILLVDDSEAVRGSLRQLLVEALPDVVVEEEAAAGAALVAVGREPWDLVMLDLSLPDRGGVQALREIRALRPELPVVVMSLHPERDYRAAMRASGATDYVSKGSPAPAIAAVVRSALGLV